jgi:hypothetical protein
MSNSASRPCETRKIQPLVHVKQEKFSLSSMWNNKNSASRPCETRKIQPLVHVKQEKFSLSSMWNKKNSASRTCETIKIQPLVHVKQEKFSLSSMWNKKNSGCCVSRVDVLQQTLAALRQCTKKRKVIRCVIRQLRRTPPIKRRARNAVYPGAMKGYDAACLPVRETTGDDFLTLRPCVL